MIIAFDIAMRYFTSINTKPVGLMPHCIGVIPFTLFAFQNNAPSSLENGATHIFFSVQRTQGRCVFTLIGWRGERRFESNESERGQTPLFCSWDGFLNSPPGQQQSQPRIRA